MRFLKEVAKNFTISTAVTLGMLAAIGIYQNGFGDKLEEKTRKIFKVEKSPE